MAAQVDADRLKGIVSTLNSIGISTGESNSKNIAEAISEGKNAGDVEALLKSLYELQQEAPKIMAALESAGYVRKNSASDAVGVEDAENDDDFEDEEEEEGSDDDDWPAVGQGVSDDISIMSDLTTPTVVDCFFVDDEEHYHEVQLITGGEVVEGSAMLVQQPKPKSLVQPVRAGHKVQRTANHRSISPQKTDPIPSGGGAAAKRRNQHIQKMAMLGASCDLPKKPLPNATKVKQKSKAKNAKFSFKDIATERSTWDPDDLSLNAFETTAIETAIYGEAPTSPVLLESSRRTGKLQTQSLMDDTDDLFESGFDAFVPLGAKPFSDFEEADASPPPKTKTRKPKSLNTKSESSFRRKPAKKLSLF